MSFGASFAGEQAVDEVLIISVDGVINPVSAEFIGKSVKKANERNNTALIIELDTPGGLDTSMRSIIKDMLGSDVPVVVFVSPSGARAASAGTFITLAAHVAAMAPQTNIGAAHPVGIGEKMDKTHAEKAENDAAAYIKSIAENRKRNAAWAEDAVRKSISATEEEALKINIIDLVTKDTASLLKEIDGRVVQTASGAKTIHTADSAVKREEMGLRLKILDLVSNPNVAYILMLLGFYGLFFELTNPGAIFPGVTGGICLILAFYALQTLPVNYAGLLLIILAIVLFVLEAQIVSHGALTIGGIIALTMGSIMLFDTGVPFIKLSLSIVIPAVIITALFFSLTLSLAFKAFRRKPVTGVEDLIDKPGTATADIAPEEGKEGMVLVQGELWSAFSDEHILKGDKIIIESVHGLKVKVKKAINS